MTLYLNSQQNLMALTPPIGGYTILPPRAARRAAASLERRSALTLYGILLAAFITGLPATFV